MYGYQQINLNYKKAVQKVLLFYGLLMTGDSFILANKNNNRQANLTWR
ncbi:hypothetical protein AO367_0684 [Moraxella catarrhalis]|uniref:Uncharacterized protein n=1 Tax=Moraxella catarrhalis TaxID=480 RepID=A0AB36DPU6_MORCA|nr:hypothetical protein AO381_0346 [Moraxella catarrhalis]OAV11208.1 hypothetical protein AO380_0643 [Moraxella catarrhalis]OAV15303.1 hypothetical protein AO376_0494 [Moraxella catarrhalis]OAV20712.1 hypothetical protein AO374_0206 [Moraxella catarrhalis]OAV26342.1 hypothetical protein AO370_0756 [Moraxella catarrhalis]